MIFLLPVIIKKVNHYCNLYLVFTFTEMLFFFNLRFIAISIMIFIDY